MKTVPFFTEDWELVVRTRLPDGLDLFVQGPEQFQSRDSDSDDMREDPNCRHSA